MAKTQSIISNLDESKNISMNRNFISLHEIPYDYSIDKRMLNIENKVRSNLLSWNGQFSPQLIELLLENYAYENSIVFDPFLGSGTLIIEAARKNIEAYGTEINPAAYHLSNIYNFCKYSYSERKQIIEYFEKSVLTSTDYDDAFLQPNQLNEEDLIGYLIEKSKSEIKFEHLILIRGLVILIDSYKNGTNNELIRKYWDNLKNLIRNLPYTKKNINIFNDDARSVVIEKDLIDLVITSPPYINVFNYHQQYRASAELLGEKVLVAARSEIGSNRKHRSNRFLTVIQYIYDMYSTFLHLKQLCKKNARIIFIVGRESNVRKTNYYNSKIIASVAKISGLDIICRQERVFTNRFGKSIYEDLLHFTNKKEDVGNNRRILEDLALEVLLNSLGRAPEESKQDINEAISSITKVHESPIFTKE
ncbi:MAG: hypothetical protein EF812_02390 [Methanosarcinales archaeon]|nr:MAG: hypothetical protein EF812_02390 [Methanosarcinales archaeon]